MNHRYNNAVSYTGKTSAMDNLEIQLSTTGRKLSSNARKVGLGETVTHVSRTLRPQKSAAGVALDGLETTAIHVPRDSCHQIVPFADSDSRQKEDAPNVSRMVSGQE